MIWPCCPVTAMESFANADELSVLPASPSDGRSVSVFAGVALASVWFWSVLFCKVTTCVPRPILATLPAVAAGLPTVAPGWPVEVPGLAVAAAGRPAAATVVDVLACVVTGAAREARSTLRSAVCVASPPFWPAALTTTSCVADENPVRSVLMV